MISRVLLKSVVWPAALVSRPSPKTWRKASKTCGWAFSISSNSTTLNGCRDTSRVSSPSGCQRSPNSRAIEPGDCISLMSKRISRSALPNRYSARAFAVSVLPTPVGPTNRKVASGRSGSLRPCCIRVTTSAAAALAAPWPTIRCWNHDRTSRPFGALPDHSTKSGRPVSWPYHATNACASRILRPRSSTAASLSSWCAPAKRRSRSTALPGWQRCRAKRRVRASTPSTASGVTVTGDSASAARTAPTSTPRVSRSLIGGTWMMCSRAKKPGASRRATSSRAGVHSPSSRRSPWARWGSKKLATWVSEVAERPV